MVLITKQLVNTNATTKNNDYAAFKTRVVVC